MAKSDVVEDITRALTLNAWDRRRVLEFFVSLRKLLEHREKEGKKNFPLLHFYCDWLLHIEKSRSIDVITLEILRELQEDLKKQIADPFNFMPDKVIKFISFHHLIKEIEDLLCEEGLNAKPINTKEKWVKLQVYLAKILSDQPLIIKPEYSLNIEMIKFLNAKARTVKIQINFNQPLKLPDGQLTKRFDGELQFDI